LTSSDEEQHSLKLVDVVHFDDAHLN